MQSYGEGGKGDTSRREGERIYDMGEEEKYKEELGLQELFERHEGHPCADRAQEVVPP